MPELSKAQDIKLRILAEGLSVSDSAKSWVRERSLNSELSSADYASTSGIILKLDDDVWVNAPYSEHNANFASEARSTLDCDGGGLFVVSDGETVRAEYCLQPEYHKHKIVDAVDEFLVVTHGDRTRLSPMNGCSMSCRFCNIPFEVKPDRYHLFPADSCIAALSAAVNDSIQPAQHILVSGGTPRKQDRESHRQLYKDVLAAFPDIPIDIMMVPVPGILDIPELKASGVNEISINVEIYDETIAKRIARQKYDYGRDYYLDFIEQATETLGAGRVRSMLLVGLEPMESTLIGVKAIAERGGVPVLSPFRPDPATPLKDTTPPSYEMLRVTYLRAREIAAGFDMALGPKCPPCTHNTLSFAEDINGKVSYLHAHPAMLH
jgi:hypothetical protein